MRRVSSDGYRGLSCCRIELGQRAFALAKLQNPFILDVTRLEGDSAYVPN